MGSRSADERWVAVAMSLSTIIVAANAQLLRRLKLQRAPSLVRISPCKPSERAQTAAGILRPSSIFCVPSLNENRLLCLIGTNWNVGTDLKPGAENS